MSHVKLSAQAGSDLSRLYDFLSQYDVTTADRAIVTIIASFDLLVKMPMGCPLVPTRKDLRKLVIPFGDTGYLAFYEYDELTDTAVVTKIRHQRERYNPKTV